MFCKTCGEKSTGAAIYCSHDGTILRPAAAGKYSAAGTMQFCPDCGTKGSSRQNYCFSCGSSMNQVTKSTSPVNLNIPSIKTESLQATQVMNSIKIPGIHTFKQSLLPVFISFVILIVMSFGVLSATKGVFNGLMADAAADLDFQYMLEMAAEETDVKMPELDKIFGMSDVVMLSNFVQPSIEASVEGDALGEEGAMTADIQLWSGLLIYILLPFIALFAGGAIQGYRSRGTGKGVFEQTLASSLLYGAALAIFAVFAGFSYKEKINAEMIKMDIDFGVHYSPFYSLIIGVVLAFLFFGTGMLFARNFRKTTGHLREMIPYGDSVHQAVSTLVRGIAVFFVFFTLYLVNKVKAVTALMPSELQLGELMDKTFMLASAFGAQLSVYIWNLIHFGPFKSTINDGEEKGSIVYSLWGGLTGDGEASSDLQMMEAGLEFTDIPLFIKLATIIPILLFMWAGYRMGHQANILSHIAVFSVLYALLLAGLASITSIGFDAEIVESSGYMEENAAFKAGFPFFSMLIRGFFFSFIFAYAGSWLRKFKQQ